jgi:hypothetical protein
VVAVVVLAAIVIVIVTGMRPEYDAFGWLVWGRETLHWALNTNGAPSWKPLPYLFTLPYALAGRGQMWLWMVTAVAAALGGAAIAGHLAYRLTGPSPARRYAPAVAAGFAALGVLGISRYWHFVLIANSDPMIVALCLGAIDCHLSGRRRWAFALLVLAGLGRPEVWPFVCVYVIWAWRVDRSMRALLGVGVAVIPALWLGIPALTARSILVAGDVAQNSASALHGDKFSGVLGRFVHLHEWPMVLAVVAGLAVALARRDRATLLVAGAALLWVAIEIAFAFHGWSAVPRYMFEPAAAMIVVAATAVGWLLACGARFHGAVGRWAGAAVAVTLVAVLLPVARSRARFVHGEISYGHKFARQVNRLRDVIERDGGSAQIAGCGQPVSELEFQSVLAWEISLNVGSVGWQPGKAIRSGSPIVLFSPRGWGWEVRAIHVRAADRARCDRLRTSTAFN